MAHPWDHAQSSAKRFGGNPADYLALHQWFDASKAHMADFRHRALRHHTQGIFWAEEVFGTVLTISGGKQVPVRIIGEQHVKEDLQRIPTIADWFRHLRVQGWMAKGGRLLYPDETDDLGSGSPVIEAGESANSL